jgi:hypothetical protein
MNGKLHPSRCVKLVVDLRGGHEAAGNYYSLPASITRVNLPLSDKAAPRSDQIREFLTLVGRGNVFVHCAGGRHRTGGMLAAVRVLVDGWTATRAMEEALQYGFYPEFGHKAWEDFILSLDDESWEERIRR